MGSGSQTHLYSQINNIWDTPDDFTDDDNDVNNIDNDNVDNDNDHNNDNDTDTDNDQTIRIFQMMFFENQLLKKNLTFCRWFIH